MIIKNIALVFLFLSYYRVTSEIVSHEQLTDHKNNKTDVLPLVNKGSLNYRESNEIDENLEDNKQNVTNVNSCKEGNYFEMTTPKVLIDISNAIGDQIDQNLTEVLNQKTNSDDKKIKTENLNTEMDIVINISITEANANITELVERQKKFLLTIVDAEADKTADGKLILTPYIEKSQFEEARNASAVNPELFLGIQSYSGFLTVNKTCNSNTFFWYFPVENKPVNETPWILWLQGGPGASSMAGLFSEIGPFKFNYRKQNLIRNPFTWLRNHSLVFIDNPIGTGFSFTECVDGYATDMTTYSNHLHNATKQLVTLFPELRQAPVYVAGESYAGKYVPALAWQIHKHRNDSGGDINLKGIMLGNAFTDPAILTNFLKPFYYFGLLQSEQLQTLMPLYKAFNQAVTDRDSVRTKLIWMLLIPALTKLDHLPDIYNFLNDELPTADYVSFLNRPEIQDALHVGNNDFEMMSIRANVALSPDFLSSSTSLIEKLLEHYRVLVYCGQLDQMMACSHLTEYYRTLKWSGSKQFHEAKREPMYEWRILKYRLVGYQKTGGGLTEAIIRGAGHMVPSDKPQVAQELVTRWTYRIPIIGNVAFKTKKGLKAVAVKNMAAEVKKVLSIF